jgi:hypothetical protein
MGEPSGVECLDTHAELGALFRLGLQYPRCGALMSSRPVWGLSASSARFGVRGGGGVRSSPVLHTALGSFSP